jgi:hypothetical protein
MRFVILAVVTMVFENIASLPLEAEYGAVWSVLISAPFSLYISALQNFVFDHNWLLAETV